MENTDRMEMLREYAVSLTASLIEYNIANRKEPWFARLDDMLDIVRADFKEAMRNLIRDKTLTYHLDLNGRTMFEFTPPEKAKNEQQQSD